MLHPPDARSNPSIRITQSIATCPLGDRISPDSEQLPGTHSVIRGLHDGNCLSPALQPSPVRILPWRCLSHRIHSEQERKGKRRLLPMYTYQYGLRNLNTYLNTFLRLRSPLGTGPMVGPATRMRSGVCWAVCSEPARGSSTPESLTAGRPTPLLKGLPVRSSAPGVRDLNDLFTPPSSKSQVPPTPKGRVLVT